MRVLVYRYGLLPPIENAALVREQMFGAHRYRNTLVEIERARRGARRALDAASGNVGALEQAAHAASEAERLACVAVKAAKGKARSSAVPQDLRDELAKARVVRRDAVAALREERRRLRDDPTVTERAEAINEAAAERRRDARAKCGVYWGSYLPIEDADRASRAQPLYDGAEANDPGFCRWTGEGTVAVQLQGGLAVADVFGADTRLRLEPLEAPKPGASRRQAQRRNRIVARDAEDRPIYASTVLSLRVGSGEDRSPIWARFPVVLHRDLPPAGTIKWAHVHLRKIGPREEWVLTITIELPDEARVPAQRGGAVAVDLGWRAFDDGRIRVGLWRGEDGASGEIALDPPTVSKLRHPDELRSQRDRNFNRARAQLVAGLVPELGAPAWLLEATATLEQWRSPARLAGLVLRWGKQRFDGDAELYDTLEAWRYHDHHLWTWESSERVKAARRRRDLFRVTAARLAGRYDVLVLEKFDLSVMARRPKADEPADNEVARANRQLVAAGELRLSLRHAFRGDVQEESAVDTTRRCSCCGHTEAFDAASSVPHTCTACHKSWDQDDNAAVNLLARYRERLAAATPAAPAGTTGSTSDAGPATETRWARAKREKRERTAQKEGAREADGNPSESLGA